jgi:hypothetical protein
MEIGQRANLLKKSVETNDMKTNALAGLIKATAEKRIKEILSSALGELTGIQKAGTKTTLDSVIKSHTVDGREAVICCLDNTKGPVTDDVCLVDDNIPVDCFGVGCRPIRCRF